MIFLIILLIAAVLLFPYGWVVLHRHRMLNRLRKRAEALGYAWKPLRRDILFSRNLSSKYDLCVEGEAQVYAVKLWACYRRGTTLTIDGEGYIANRRRQRHPIEPNEGNGDGSVWRYTRRRRVPRTVLKSNEATEKKTVFVLLNYPTYDGIVFRGRGQEQPVLNGSVLFGKVFYTPSAFEKELYRSVKSKEPSR